MEHCVLSKTIEIPDDILVKLVLEKGIEYLTQQIEDIPKIETPLDLAVRIIQIGVKIHFPLFSAFADQVESLTYAFNKPYFERIKIELLDLLGLVLLLASKKADELEKQVIDKKLEIEKAEAQSSLNI